MDGLADKTAYSAKLLVKYSSKWATKRQQFSMYVYIMLHYTRCKHHTRKGREVVCACLYVYDELFKFWLVLNICFLFDNVKSCEIDLWFTMIPK